MSSSRRKFVIGAAAVLGWLSTAAGPTTAYASELCKTRRGALLVRDACKVREQKLDAAALGGLGLRGPAGPPGPPGSPGGGLHVVDANGSDVGLVTSISNSYYGQYARLLRETALPGGSSPEFIQFSVSTQGLATSEYACSSYYGTYFKTPDCAGQKYEQCEYGNCSSVAGAFLFTNSNVNAVAHPTGYTGAGGVASVAICIDPGQPPTGGTAQALQAMANVATVWNANVGSNNNIVPVGNVPPGQVAFDEF